MKSHKQNQNYTRPNTLKELREIYIEDETPTDVEDIDVIRSIVSNLPIYSQQLLLLYAEYHSVRKVGDVLGCSSTAVFNMIKKIQEEIKCKYNYYLSH